MVTLGMDNYYFDVLRRSQSFTSLVARYHALHAPTHLNVPTTPNTTTVDQSK